MDILLKFIGGGWAFLGVLNIAKSPILDNSSGVGLTFLLMFNVLLFILPGLVVFGIGSAITKKEDPAKKNSQTMQCPYCAETIKAQAKVCRFCNRGIPESERKISPESTEDVNVNDGRNTLKHVGYRNVDIRSRHPN